MSERQNMVSYYRNQKLPLGFFVNGRGSRMTPRSRIGSGSGSGSASGSGDIISRFVISHGHKKSKV